jgi:hypothetical protein
MNAGPAHLIRTEADMKAPILNFASAFDDEDFAKLFSLYPAADFEEQVKSYENGKGDADPEVPVHYFRLSQMLRDILFTCSSIDFGYEISKHNYELSSEFQGVRLYTLNQSMLTPLWKEAGMPYVSVSHGSGKRLMPPTTSSTECFRRVRSLKAIKSFRGQWRKPLSGLRRLVTQITPRTSIGPLHSHLGVLKGTSRIPEA